MMLNFCKGVFVTYPIRDRLAIMVFLNLVKWELYGGVELVKAPRELLRQQVKNR